MSIPLESLRQLAAKELDRVSLKYPKVAEGIESLKRRALSRLEGDAIEYDAVEELLEGIVRDADELENQLGEAAGGYVFAISQDLTAKLENLAKITFSLGVLTLPELNVELSLAGNSKPLSQEADKPGPGARTKFGGSPDWIQNNQTPICARCKKPMTFVAQIDSVSAAQNELGRALEEHNSYMFADTGMIYVFWCGKCNATHSMLQCS